MVNRTKSAESELFDMLKRFCGLDDRVRTFMDEHSGECACAYCQSASAEYIADDLQALLWMLDKVACTISSCVRRGPGISDN